MVGGNTLMETFMQEDSNSKKLCYVRNFAIDRSATCRVVFAALLKGFSSSRATHPTFSSPTLTPLEDNFPK